MQIGRVFITLLPQWARFMWTNCCHYQVWCQWGPLEFAVERKKED